MLSLFVLIDIDYLTYLEREARRDESASFGPCTSSSASLRLLGRARKRGDIRRPQTNEPFSEDQRHMSMHE